MQLQVVASSTVVESSQYPQLAPLFSKLMRWNKVKRQICFISLSTLAFTPFTAQFVMRRKNMELDKWSVPARF